jgi:hypothetical protein
MSDETPSKAPEGLVKSFQAASAWFELARKMEEERRYDEALEDARKALQCCPDNDVSGLRSQLHMFLGRLQNKAG